MARDFEQEAFADHVRGIARKEWFQAQVEAIRQSVSAYDVLARHGHSLKKQGGQQEQISCPFHGTDNRPSARYYPETARGPSAVWCFVCRESWDCIGLWKKFTGESKFSTVLWSLERAFGLTPPEFNSGPSTEDTYDPDKEDVQNLFQACENRLSQERGSFDMTTHLKLGSILDLLRFEVDRGGIPLTKAKEHLQLVSEKISKRVRAVP